MKYNELTAVVKSPIFTRTDLALSGHKVLDGQLSLWVKKGHLLRLKKGVYVFSRERDRLRGEDIAPLLYSPQLSQSGKRPCLVRLHSGDRLCLHQCDRKNHTDLRKCLRPFHIPACEERSFLGI